MLAKIMNMQKLNKKMKNKKKTDTEIEQDLESWISLYEETIKNINEDTRLAAMKISSELSANLISLEFAKGFVFALDVVADAQKEIKESSSAWTTHSLQKRSVLIT